MSRQRRREEKTKWNNLVFVPRGADREAHGIKHGDEGFLHLCQKLYNGDHLHDYAVFDSAFRPGDGGRNVARDWAGFNEAVAKQQTAHPPKPSVFAGRYQHCEEGRELRQRVLHAICREYQHPEALADDLWAFIRQGKQEEAENLVSILALYSKEPSQRPECRSTWLNGSAEPAGRPAQKVAVRSP